MVELNFHDQELINFMSALYEACPFVYYQKTNKGETERFDKKLFVSRNFCLTKETAKIITRKGILLDLGSSASPHGIFLLYKNIISELVCIDELRNQMERLKEISESLGLKNRVNPIRNNLEYGIPLNKSSCDYIISFDFLFREFLTGEQNYTILNDCYRVLRRNGKIFIAFTYTDKYSNAPQRMSEFLHGVGIKPLKYGCFDLEEVNEYLVGVFGIK